MSFNPTATGTGIPKIVSGVQTSAAALIVDADVSGSAAIAASKVVQATGTGFPHITAGALDSASVALTWTGDATGTGTGASFAITVVKANGASVPAAGSLTTGNAAYVSGASALTYSALNLAGGSGWVTGTLPVANGGTGVTSLTVPASGLLVGTTDTQTLTNKTIVAASNTITDTSAALGDILHFDGTRFSRLARGSSNTYLQSNGTDIGWTSLSSPAVPIAALNIDWSLSGSFTKTLAGGANTITFSNQGSGMTITVRLTGVVNSTVTWPTVTWAGGVAPVQSPNGTDVYTFWDDGTSVYGSFAQAGAGTTSGQLQTVDGAGRFTAPSNVLAGSGFISVGASPATTGNLRVPSGVTAMAGLSSTSTNITLMEWTALDRLYIGADSGLTTAKTVSKLNFVSQAGIFFINAGGTYLSQASGNNAFALPVTGDGGQNSPWGGMNGFVVHSMSGAGATDTLSSTEYANSIIKVTGTGSNIIKIKAVTDAQAYMKFIWNAGSGTLAVQDTNAVAAAATLAAGTGAWFLWSNASVKQLSAAFTVA